MNIMSEADHNEEPSTSKLSGYIAIGCGSEGTDSVERFLKTVPANSGLAFILCAKLSSHFLSRFIKTLKKTTQLEVVLVQSDETISPNTIYVHSPYSDLTFNSGKLFSMGTYSTAQDRHPFDILLRTISSDKLDCAAILMPGCGTDGSKGIIHIEDHGGLVLKTSDVPDDENTPFLQSLDPEEMLATIVNHFEMDEINLTSANSEQNVEAKQINNLLSLLEDSFNVNFKQYKLGTIKRRIAYRMKQCKSMHLKSYLEFIDDKPEELNSLYKDFMIGVTKFFRDSDAFSIVEEKVISKLFTSNTEVRIWIPGVATGEEAYSMAILIDQYCQKNDIENPNYKIFATDAHHSSVRQGMEGYYDPDSIEQLSPYIQENYFVRSHRNYQVSPSIRKRVVFAQHNLLSDPPFTKVDLVSCRNLLIYFNERAQQKALSLILFALKPNGYLFLGPSESPNESQKYLDTINAKWRIFQKKTTTSTHHPPFQKFKVKTSIPNQKSRFEKTISNTPLSNMIEAVIEKSIPNSLIIDDKGIVLHTLGNCDLYLKKMLGKISLYFEDVIKPELQIAIQIARKKAIDTSTKIECGSIQFEDDDRENRFVNITVDPIPETIEHKNCVQIIFEKPAVQEVTQVNTASSISKKSLAKDESGKYKILRKELQEAKYQLQETVHQLESSNQELQMANEELLTSNEELQSTNEELHSVNEELFSVNAEYELKNRELFSLNLDINNLLRSTEIGTLFVDSNLRIRKFTPAISESMNLLPTDIGRPIDHISHKFTNYDDLVIDTQTVIETGTPIEKEAKADNDSWFLVRILQFKAEKSKSDGAVITFINISALKKAEEQIQENQRKLQLALEAAQFGLWTWDPNTKEVEYDNRFIQKLESDSSKSTQHANFLQAIESTTENLKTLNFDDSQNTFNHSWNVNLKNGEEWYLSARGIVYRNTEGKIIRVSGVIWDETEIKIQESKVLQKKNDLETLLYVISHDLREPLRAIQTFSKLLDEGYSEQLEAKAHDFLVRIDRGAERMSALLDDVLKLSQVNRMETPKELIIGAKLIESALRGLEQRITETGASIIVANDLPEIRGNSTFAKQAIYNLINNALKFTQDGKSPDIEIAPMMSNSSTHVGIVVRDRGPGIPENCDERIFKLFQRAVGREIQGTGAGLAIVKQIAIKHGGDAWYEPRPGGGAIFTITFAK